MQQKPPSRMHNIKLKPPLSIGVDTIPAPTLVAALFFFFLLGCSSFGWAQVPPTSQPSRTHLPSSRQVENKKPASFLPVPPVRSVVKAAQLVPQAASTVSSPSAKEPTAGKKQKISGAMQLMAEQFRRDYWDKGPLLALLMIFLMGFLVSLTPCVYPMIPITIAVIGASSSTEHKGRFHSLVLSFLYVLGMAVPASLLGLLVSYLGSLPFMMGGLMQSPYFLATLVIVFSLMALSMFGAFEMALPSSWQTRLAAFQGHGYLGVFVLGMIGIVLSTPCSGPVMIGLLAFLAQIQNPLLGIILPTILAFGIGVPFFVLGGGVVSALPRSGKWMVEIKKIFGIILLAAAFFYANYLFRHAREMYILLVSLMLLYFAIASGAFRSFEQGAWWWDRLKQLFGLICLITGGYLFFGLLFTQGFLWPSFQESLSRHAQSIASMHPPSAHPAGYNNASSQINTSASPISARLATSTSQDPCLPPALHPSTRPYWFTSEAQGIACAKKLKRPVIIDFWAEWCTSCKELEVKSFNHPAVVPETRRFVMIKVEYTEDSPEGDRLRKKYEIPGLPWVRFIDSNGHMLKQPLIVGFIPHLDLLHKMHVVK